MRKLPLDRIEELVEESVFHPSPCKRHRELVLRDAVRATFRQKITRRMMVAASGALLVLGIGIFVVRMATSSTGPASTDAPPSTSATVEIPAQPSAQAKTSGSIGEGLYRGTDTGEHSEASKGL